MSDKGVLGCLRNAQKMNLNGMYMEKLDTSPGDNGGERSLFVKYQRLLFLFVVALGFLIHYFAKDHHGAFWEFIGHVGLFISAVVAVHLIYELSVKEHQQRMIKEENKKTVVETAGILKEEIQKGVVAIADILIPARTRWGLTAFHESLDFSELFSSLVPGDQLLWLDTYCPDYKRFLPNLKAAVSNGAVVKMLVVDPISDVAKYRAQEISYPNYEQEVFCRNIASFLDEVGRVFTDTGMHITGSLEIRKYSDLPSLPMYIRSREGKAIVGYTSFYLTQPTAFFAHLEWSGGSDSMLSWFEKYFLQKWKRHKDHVVYFKSPDVTE